jgi:hypothetical protein
MFLAIHSEAQTVSGALSSSIRICAAIEKRLAMRRGIFSRAF